MHSPAMAMAFSLFVLCFITCSLSGLVLFFFKSRQINAALKHPSLQHRPFERYPLAIKAVAEGKANEKAIVTDYFTLDDIQNAMDRSVQDKANIVKGVVTIS